MLDVTRAFTTCATQHTTAINFIFLHYWQGSGNNVSDIIIERSPSQEMDYFTPQNSLLGSISALQLLYEGGSGEIENLLNLSMNDVAEIEHSEEDVFGDYMDRSGISKKDESEYCIVRNETETNDGWMVLSDD